ncbi:MULTISPECIES: hypothetical protein [Haloferacaceae]|uniref:Uncharacterized protein n=1 Tax=Halorubrum glutamatedens TaxID=2707018 RepID=A0ABD5QR27_9EURY|nr:hypothetical protein [Halobellus captivus]
MDRGNFPYLLLHYLVMIGAILVVVDGIERAGYDLPLYVGVAVAVAVGVAYPRIVAFAGVAPERWESS